MRDPPQQVARSLTGMCRSILLDRHPSRGDLLPPGEARASSRRRSRSSREHQAVYHDDW